jgi:nucleoside-diphosphate-sugar epimerase
MRFHTVYSSTPRSGMFFDKLINNSIEYVTNHERDFIHIDDVCDAVILLISASITGPVDIGTGTTVRISEILPSLPIRNNLPYERTKTLANTSILNSLGFYPKHHVKDFIGQLLSR